MNHVCLHKKIRKKALLSERERLLLRKKILNPKDHLPQTFATKKIRKKNV